MDDASQTCPPTELSDAEQQRLLATAYHEAGHAVMAVLLGRTVHKVSIHAAQLPVGGVRLGACQLKKGRSKSSEDPLEAEVLILLAGMVAESYFTGQYCPHGARLDLLAVRQLLSTRAASDRQVERLQRRCLDRTEYELSTQARRAAMENIANELVRQRTLSGRAVVHHVRQAEQRFD